MTGEDALVMLIGGVVIATIYWEQFFAEEKRHPEKDVKVGWGGYLIACIFVYAFFKNPDSGLLFFVGGLCGKPVATYLNRKP